jgi:hypothetical protein
MIKKIAAILLLASPLFGGSTAVGNLRGLNNADASIMISDSEAQDLLNVESTANGFGFKKRDGYDLFKTVGVSTHPVKGGYNFRDVNGQDTTVHTNDGMIYKSVNSSNYTAFITTDTPGTYTDFTDSNGFLWRATSGLDEIAKYDGTTLTYYPDTPKGNQIEVSPDRLIISGASGYENRIYFSGAADFTDFSEGGLEDTSPFWEDVSLSGQYITAIKWSNGRLLFWTKNTFGYWAGSNQFDSVVEDISTTIGTIQPQSVIEDLGTIYFQGQDGHFYSYDFNTVQRISRPITGSVETFVGGEAKNWTQTNQADWQAGTLTDLSATLSVGDVVLSTWTDVDTSSTDFTAGSLFNASITEEGNIILNSSGTFPGGQMTHSFWSVGGSGWSLQDVSGSSYAFHGSPMSYLRSWMHLTTY